MSLAQVRRATRASERRHATGGGTSPTLVNHYSSLTTVAATSRTITGVTATVGRVVVLLASTAIANPAKYIDGVTDTGGNTWTMRRQEVGAPGSQNTGAEIWTTTITTALSGGTVTITSSGASTMGNYDITVWSGVTTTGIVGAVNGVDVNQGTSPACTVTMAGAGVVLGCTTYGSTTSAPSAGPGTGWTTLSGGTSTTGDYGTSAYQIVTTGGSYGPVWTSPTSTAWGLATIGLAAG